MADISPEDRASFANAVNGDWDQAMDRFFTKVDDERRKRNLSDFDVMRMLETGYGEDVAAEWQDWTEEWSEDDRG